MRLEVHTEAAKNFDMKAEELVSRIIRDPHSRRQRSEGGFTPGTVTHELPEVAEVIVTGYVKPHGSEEIAKTFSLGQDTLGLFEEGYRDLVRLAEKIWKVKTIRDHVSLKTLIDLIFKWVAAKYQQAMEIAMTAYVLAECEKELREFEMWIPVAMLNIESEIPIGKVTLKTVTKELLDPWFDAVARSAINSTEAQIEAQLDEWRREWQGFAAATIKVFAEPRRASELALEEAERAVALIRVFSPASHIPELTSYTVLRGKERMEGFTALTIQGGRIVRYSEDSINFSTPYWVLDNEKISEVQALGLGQLSDLLNRDTLTEYQRALLDSVLLYSKAAIAKDPADKLIATIVALESFLLKDGNEPIQQNLAERIAFLFKSTATERREKKKQVLSAYGLRSSFIHHGHSIEMEEMDILREFLQTAWLSFIVLIERSDYYKTKADLFNHLEDLKMT